MNPQFDLTGRVALVTGGSKGLGRAMALGFAEAGADLVIASRKLPGCEAVAKEVEALGRRALPVSCHVADWEQCSALVDRCIAELGRIDVLVNNAGIAPVAPHLIDVTEELFDKTIAVNLKGPMRLAALAAEHMEAGSSIINISSVASLRPATYTSVYGAAKAGLNTMTRVMAQDFASRGIRANAIVCGSFWTDSLRKAVPNEEAAAIAAEENVSKRIADAAEIVGTALYLATDASSYTNGQLIQIDGGVLP